MLFLMLMQAKEGLLQILAPSHFQLAAKKEFALYLCNEKQTPEITAIIIIVGVWSGR